MVFGLLNRDSGSVAGLSAPAVTLTFGGGGGGLGGGLGDLASDLGVGGGGAAPLEAGLVSLRLARGFAPAVDWAELVLVPVPGGAEIPSLGDPGSIGIAVGDDRADFACQVNSVEHRADGSVRLGLGNGGRVLAQARAETAFAEQDPGAIIDALCADAGVDSQAGSAGERVPRYVVDGGTPLLDHVARLAAAAGRLAHFDNAGVLQLLDDSADGEEIPLAAGDAILDFRLTARAGPGAIRVDGAGAADSGGNAWAWLRKAPGPQRAEAGTAPPQRVTAAPWVRSQAGPDALTAARARALERDAAQGRLLLGSHPQAVPGALLAFSGTPADGSWRVLASETRFDRESGFANTLCLARYGAAMSGGLGGFL